MNKEGSVQVQEQARTELKKLIGSSGAYDPTRGFFDIDRIWQDPQILVSFSKHLSSYIRGLGGFERINGLLAADSVHFPFGCIPIASLASVDLGLPLMIWKENAKIITNESFIWGAREGYRVLILHDVTRYGLTVVKEIVDLFETGCVPEIVLTIANSQLSADAYILEKAREITHQTVRFESLFTLTELGGVTAAT